MSPEEKAFYRLIANLVSEGKLLGDASERVIAQFEVVVESKNDPDYKTPPER